MRRRRRPLEPRRWVPRRGAGAPRRGLTSASSRLASLLEEDRCALQPITREGCDNRKWIKDVFFFEEPQMADGVMKLEAVSMEKLMNLAPSSEV